MYTLKLQIMEPTLEAVGQQLDMLADQILDEDDERTSYFGQDPDGSQLVWTLEYREGEEE